MKAESSKVTKRRLSSETLELIRQRGIARAAGKCELTSKLAKQCRQAIKEDLKERRAAVMVEAAEARKSIRKARRSFANSKTEMIAPQRSDGTITASREKIIYDYYSVLFDSHVHFLSYKIKGDGYAVSPVLPYKI
uniref:SAP domain-containing protein n=1 Tax=Angiostrongylus cantonensis TaxID=6313 RepID=A0A0K0D3Y0_ANGCA